MDFDMFNNNGKMEVFNYDECKPRLDNVNEIVHHILKVNDTIFPHVLFNVMSNGVETYVSVAANGEELASLFYAATMSYPQLMNAAMYGITAANEELKTR